VAVNGMVLIGVNRVKDIAAVNKANVTAGNELSVKTGMKGNGKIYTTSVQGGFVAVGATVAVVYLGGESDAFIDVVCSYWSGYFRL
jgi:hypothetical protein